MSCRQLGNIDYSSQKLFGRRSEVELLKTLYKNEEKGPVAAFVRGPSGSGKSLLINHSLRNVKNNEEVFLLSGKFDQFHSGEAFSVLVEAVSGLSQDDTTTAEANSAILQIIPSLQNASTMQSSSPGKSQDEPAVMRGWGFEMLKMLLRDYLKKLCLLRKTILFLDNLQWCDDKSYIDLISSLLNDPEMENLIFVGGIRSEGGSRRRADFNTSCTSFDSCLAAVDQLEDMACSTTLNINQLDIETCNLLVSDLLHLEPESTKELTQVLHKKTDGNAFFLIQFIQMLERSDLLCYSLPHIAWTFDVKKIESETSLADNVVDAVVGKIKELPAKAQDILKVAACLGGRFDPLMVRELVNNLPNGGFDICKDSMREMLELCTRQGLVSAVSVKLEESNSNQEFFTFAHDKIQQASYLTIESTERPSFHLMLGRMLKGMTDDSSSQLTLLVATRQMNRGRFLIEDPNEKLLLANLNLVAAKTLMKDSAFFPASDFVDISLELYGEQGWTDHYDFYLETLTTGAKLDYSCGKAERCQLRVKEIIVRAKTLNDTIPAYFTLVDMHSLKRNYEQALSVGYDFLKQLGVDVTKRGGLVNVAYAFLSILPEFKKRTDNELLSIPMTDDENVVLAIKMLQSLLSSAYWLRRDYEYGYMVITMMKLTIKNGTTSMGGAVFSIFAGLCAAMGKFELAKRLGGLGQELDGSIGDKAYRCKSMMHYLVFVGTTKSTYYKSLDLLLEAHRIGMEVGDLDHSSLCSYGYVVAYYLAGLPLESMAKDATMFSLRMVEYGQWQTLMCLKLYHQCALNLMGKASGSPARLEGGAIENIDEHLQSEHTATGFTRTKQVYATVSLQLTYYFRDSQMSLKAAELNESFKESDWPAFHALANPFFRALVWIEAARTHRKRHYARKARICIQKMEKGMKQGMVNLFHMLLIAKAEYWTLTCKPSQVQDCKAAFDEAGSVCARSGFTQGAALTYELSGRFMLRCDDEDWGLHYLKQSAELYHEWGADGKANQLDLEFDLFSKVAHKRRGKMGSGIRGRARFQEADQAGIHKGRNDLAWSIASSDAGSSEDGSGG